MEHTSSAVAPGILQAAMIRGTFLFGSRHRGSCCALRSEEYSSSAVAPGILLRASARGTFLFGSCSGDLAVRRDPKNTPLRQLLRGSCCPPRSEEYSSSAVAPGILPRLGSVSIRLRGLRRDGISQMSNASIWPFPLALKRVVRNQLWERIQALRPVASLRRRRVRCMR